MRGHRHGHLEQEGRLALGLVDEALTITSGLLHEAGTTARRVVDLGCGPGLGTTALATAFPEATVVAVDNTPDMLDRTAARATSAGHRKRVQTRQLDLDGDLTPLGRFDVVWASMSIHHAHDIDAALRGLRAVIAPGGLLCMLERAAPLSVACTDHLGRPGIWDRLADAHRRWRHDMRPHLPTPMTAEVTTPMLTGAGLRVVVDRTFTREVPVPGEPSMRDFVAGVLRSNLTNLPGIAPADDLRALAGFLDGTAPDRWEGLTVTISRRLFIATEPVRAG